MADFTKLEFFLLRYVPDAVKDEFVNIGLVMFESGPDGRFADVRLTRDWRGVRCLDPEADIEMLEALETDFRGRLADAGERQVFLRKLEDSFSNAIRISPTKACLAQQPAQEMETLASLYFGGRRRAPGWDHRNASDS